MRERGIDPVALAASAGLAPWVQPPTGHVTFDEQGVAAVPLIVAAPVVVLTFTVPQGYDGVIERISNNYIAGGFVSGSGDLIWRILTDNRPLKNFAVITAELGTLQVPRPVSQIRLYSGQVVQYVVDHIANAALGGNTICTLAGYYYPRRGET